MAAWTDPRTWVTSEVVTAALMNAHVRDNELFLYEGLAGQFFKNESQGLGFFAIPANQANLVPAIVQRKATITAFRFQIGTSSGNIDVGVYDSGFTRLWSRGSVACPSAGAAEILISAGTPTTLTLTPAVYWMAFCPNNGTATWGGIDAEMKGILKGKTSSFPLPSSITSPTETTTGTAPIGILAT